MIKPTYGIAVDGACSGNPGPGEYRGVDLASGEELFRVKFNFVTNNLMEFFAIVHALKYRKEHGLNSIIYSDSVTGIAWAKTGCNNTSLEKSEKTSKIHEFIGTCNRWLGNNTKADNLPIEKWDTVNWGEIPADFGNKKHAVIQPTPHKQIKEKVEEKYYEKTKVVESGIPKYELKEWIEEQWKEPLQDITTLAKLAKRFNITIEHK
jgi:ribonuclease HI